MAAYGPGSLWKPAGRQVNSMVQIALLQTFINISGHGTGEILMGSQLTLCSNSA